ncbi:Fe-S cluster assembly protein SufD [Candidatus Steffania adelgidicola]|uniref:Fe-S cluster assembly protein SufD n=1 Tax=Candidatus Steffania adelgidicola TaxID=1076626 RepID=UPI001D0227A0|nr:Fe-S cluster assembly protein SufD [Candidatus Steffania adelgidicola]UDG80028.1 FeS cluster assembly protein SufD [Candidatus Steffania adelgidicola]
MVGLPNNSNTCVLTQWHQLFADQGMARSVEACGHWQNVKRLGLPTCQHEHWKYTPLDRFLAHRFTPATNCTPSVSDRNSLSLTLNAYRLVLVNGYLSPSLSDNDTGLWQIEVEENGGRRLMPPPIQPEVFLHLTESLSQARLRIYLQPGKVEPRPLYLLHISQGSEDQETLSTLHYRHHINVGAGAQGQVIEHFTSLGSEGHFSGSRTSMVINDNATLSHIKLAFESRASYHFSHNDIRMNRCAVVRSSTFIIGPGLTRHQISAQLNGEEADLVINSLLLPSGRDISDTRTYVEHNKGSCLSRQLHKVIARDRGRGVFNGLIKVAKHASHTDAKMNNNNLILNRLAEVDTKPQLEIYSDDVKCSHGTTVGIIDKEQVFYLRSRGISLENAKKIIIYAFASEVTRAIDNESVSAAILTCISDSLEKVAT